MISALGRKVLVRNSYHFYRKYKEELHPKYINMFSRAPGRRTKFQFTDDPLFFEKRFKSFTGGFEKVFFKAGIG